MRHNEHMDETASQADHAEGCALCGHDYPFTMPRGVVEAVEEGRLVLFAGAGISTEWPNAFPESFYEDIRCQLSEEPDNDSFPGVMTAYEAEFGRLKLVEECFQRIRFAETFPSLRRQVTRFHREVSSIFNLREIITTNWDAFFEQESGAIPIVVDADYAFYNLPERKVFKIHGSLGNISTLIATLEDYSESEEKLRTSAIGGTLRHLLATKVVVFVGFSLRDHDFQSTYEPLLEGMGKLRPAAFFVSPFESDEARAFGMKHIRTDGTHFVRSLKAHLVERGTSLADERIGIVASLREYVSEAHLLTADMNFREHPLLVYSLAYQDGLLDSIDRVRAQARTGEYNDRDRVHQLVHSHEHLLHEAVQRRRYWDASYIDGYMNGLILLLTDDAGAVSGLPLYELFDPNDFPSTSGMAGQAEREAGSAAGEQQAPTADEADRPAPPTLLGEEELVSYLEPAAEDIPELVTEATRILTRVPEGQVPQHTPFLHGVLDDHSTMSQPDGTVETGEA
jgi:hypothetical protein